MQSGLCDHDLTISAGKGEHQAPEGSKPLHLLLPGLPQIQANQGRKEGRKQPLSDSPSSSQPWEAQMAGDFPRNGRTGIRTQGPVLCQEGPLTDLVTRWKPHCWPRSKYKGRAKLAPEALGWVQGGSERTIFNFPHDWGGARKVCVGSEHWAKSGHMEKLGEARATPAAPPAWELGL